MLTCNQPTRTSTQVNSQAAGWSSAQMLCATRSLTNRSSCSTASRTLRPIWTAVSSSFQMRSSMLVRHTESISAASGMLTRRCRTGTPDWPPDAIGGGLGRRHAAMVIWGCHVSLPDFDANRAELIGKCRWRLPGSREVAVRVEVGSRCDDSGAGSAGSVAVSCWLP